MSYDTCLEVDTGDTHCYFVVRDVSGSDAIAQCGGGSHVATITSDAENNFIKEYLSYGALS